MVCVGFVCLFVVFWRIYGVICVCFMCGECVCVCVWCFWCGVFGVRVWLFSFFCVIIVFVVCV